MPKESILDFLTADFNPLIKSMTEVIKPFNKAMEEQHRVRVRLVKTEEEAIGRVVRKMGTVETAIKPPNGNTAAPKSEMTGKNKNSGAPNGMAAPLKFGEALISTGAYKMISDMAADGAGYSIGSKYGSESGNIASNAAGGAVTGAMTGMMLGAQMGSVIPVWGTIIGAAAGAVIGTTLGAIQGNIENKQNRDNAFKDVVKSQFDKVIAQQQKDIQTGSALAAAQEINSMIPPTKSFVGLTEQLAGLEQSQQMAMGEGYNKERKDGLEKQIKWMNGEQGGQMAKANELIGQFQASLENEKEEKLRTALSDTMKTKEYAKALAAGDGAEAGRLLMEARAKADNDYLKGEEGSQYQKQLASQKQMLTDMRAELSNGWENFGYSMSQEFTKGIERGKVDLMLSLIPEGTVIKKKNARIFLNTDNIDPQQVRKILDSNPKSRGGKKINTDNFDPQQLKEMLDSNPKKRSGKRINTDKVGEWPGDYTFGMNNVPYDNFPALLHQGERVLTASEARSADIATPSISITGNSFTVREEADIDRVAASLLSKLTKARFTYAT